MGKVVAILTAIVLVVALPFVFRQGDAADDDRGLPTLTIVTPHNEAIRHEFARGFSKWHKARFGTGVRIDWRNIGGTTEIGRYLTSEYAAGARAWWKHDGKDWPAGATEAVVSDRRPVDPVLAQIYDEFRQTDDATQFTVRVDLFFGGGEFDHSSAFARGFTVNCEKELPPGLFVSPDGVELIPTNQSGETWRTASVFGNAISAFGVVYNKDRLRDLKVDRPPASWDDLADPVYFGQLGAADPTKSGSIAKAFEMIVHRKMYDAVRDLGLTDAQIAEAETEIEGFQKTRPGCGRWEVPDHLLNYQLALERGWEKGVALLQSIGANARYFTDSASKVPIDVSMGDAAVGMAIDFYGRFQVQTSARPDGRSPMVYATVVGGSSMSCDPISLLRGAPQREIAVRFIEFTLSEEGQRLWTYKPGTPGGPEKFALRRLPIRRDFYPSTNPAIQQKYEQHKEYAADPLGAVDVDPYQLSDKFVYHRRWTGGHFSVLREIVKAMCLDSGDELRAAWRTIHRGGGEKEALLAELRKLPTVRLRNRATGEVEDVPLNWRTSLRINKDNYEPLEYMRAWTAAFRAQYRRVAGE